MNPLLKQFREIERQLNTDPVFRTPVGELPEGEFSLGLKLKFDLIEKSNKLWDKMDIKMRRNLVSGYTERTKQLYA